MRILVADDNADAAEALAELFTLCGHDVRLVHDGEEAVRAALEWQPHAAVLDLNMPRLDGVSAALQIRRQFPRIVLVALTGQLSGPPGTALGAAAAAFDKRFSKGESFQTIRTELERLCRP